MKPKNAEDCARLLGEARAEILELRQELRICRNALFIENEELRRRNKPTIHDYAIDGADELLSR